MGKLGAALLVLLFVGCGGSSGSTTQADCRAFIEMSYCPKVVTCYAGQIDQTTCVSAAQQGLDCSKAVSENADPAVCMTDLANASCDSFVVGTSIVLPGSCFGLFQLTP